MRPFAQEPGSARDRLAVALDFPTAAEALSLVDELGDQALWYKVGLQLFLSDGSAVLAELRRRERRIFLDLKLHDIPNTVAGAVRSLRHYGVDLLTIHAAGGAAMMAAAVAACDEPGSPALLAVTVLTSMDAEQLTGTGVIGDPQAQVLRLGELAMGSGVAGLVCSPQEIVALRERLGAAPYLVVPGIRSATDAPGDQRRTASAAEAIRAGASLLVVGRPITQAAEPGQAVASLLREIGDALPQAAETRAGFELKA